MSTDTKYKNWPYIFQSRGIYSRYTIDRPPGEGWYLNLDSCEEREEQSLSSRYGSLIINRDPLGIGTSNYFFTGPPNTIARLVSGSSTWRYVGVTGPSSNTLWRRAGDSQGPFTKLSPTNIYGGTVINLSGQQFSTLVTPCYQSAQPYLFIADALAMLKDSGIGNPVSWGILGPTQVVNTLPGALGIFQGGIDAFDTGTGFTTSGFTITTITTIATVNGSSGTGVLTYEKYSCTDGSSALVQDGCIGLSNHTGQFMVKFDTTQDTTKFNVINFLGGTYAATDSFLFNALNGTVATNSIGSIGKTTGSFPVLTNMTPDDFIVLVIQVGSPEVVQEIRLQFDVNSSGYTSTYYYKSITPQTFQTGVSSPSTTSPAQAVTNEVSGQAGGVVNSNTFGLLTLPQDTQTEIKQQPLTISDPSVPRLQPVNISTGTSAWSVVYMRKGDFLPVGNADEPGADWSKVTGWQIQIITNTQGSTAIGLNGLYTLSGAGPSSYGGVGYDYRYTYFDAVTNTESNPCSSQYYPVTTYNPAGISTLIVLRQPINVQGQYSPNPRVTHVRIYRRGGVLPGPAWLLVDQIPNVIGTGTFSYNDIFTDADLFEQLPLNLANDPPVSSTLQNPIVTTLTTALSPTAPFIPITVSVTQLTATFVVGQIVNIGNVSDLEQTIVAVGGTGSFQACVQLPHAAGEQVQVFSKPAIPCNLVALAYNQVWLAGDPNNPHLLYFSNPGFPENFPPQNYIPVSNPSDPIMGVINFRGTLFIATKSTWYQIYPSNPPVAQPTGSKHGLAASFGWCQTESAIWYLGFDGVREFNGTDGAYRSATIEWLFQNQPTTPSPSPLIPLNQALISQVKMAFWNNRVFVIYPGTDGNNHRLVYWSTYNRWKNDDLFVNAINYEADTNTLVIARVYQPSASQTGTNFVVAVDQVGDYDDAGWASGALVKYPISFTLQTPYYDQSLPNNQKQYNMVTVDANPNGQSLTLELLFDDNNGSVAPITLPSFTGAVRQKFQFTVNAGFGQEAYRLSAQLSGSVIVAPIIYQMEMLAAELAAQLNSYDTYWIKFGTDESKLVKQGYFDYTSTAPVIVGIYADGNVNSYYSFTLPTNAARSESPTRVRFPAIKLRQFRLIATTTGNLQFWNAPQIDQKPVIDAGAKGYQRSELVTS
jgi:hypothetical protein